jgi:hypothetical protein
MLRNAVIDAGDLDGQFVSRRHPWRSCGRKPRGSAGRKHEGERRFNGEICHLDFSVQATSLEQTILAFGLDRGRRLGRPNEVTGARPKGACASCPSACAHRICRRGAVCGSANDAGRQILAAPKWFLDLEQTLMVSAPGGTTARALYRCPAQP